MMSNEFLKYAIAGGLAFFVDYGTLLLLNFKIGINYLASAGIAFLGGLTVNYILSTKWVFEHRSIDNKNREFAIFSGIGLVGLLLNEIIMLVFTGTYGMAVQFSKIISTVAVFLWNYFGRKTLLFKEKGDIYQEYLESENLK